MTDSLDLNGTWQLGWFDGVRGNAAVAERDEIDPARFFSAQVPGEVHLDLERAGVIDDVRVGLNALKARWVEEVRWSYRKEFDAPAEAITAGGAWLVFEGLDLSTRIVLNGQEIGTHDNSYTPCRVNIAGKLRAGRNVLVIHIESGLFGVADKPLGKYQYLQDHRLNKRHWLRKAQCQFEWDWSPRLINIGVTKPVRLEWAAVANIEQLAVRNELSSDLARGTVHARLFVEGLKETRATLGITVGAASRSVDVTIKPGLHPYEVSVTLDKPEPWWPAEHGAQHLYPVRVSLAADGKIIGERTAKVGFRHVRINQDVHPNEGRYFILEINGRKIFAKGANWAPGDLIIPRCDRARYARQLALAREAHFNFLRINGCGIYETDDFYDICDELGIMIWQDFPFTNIHYPFSDGAFHDACEAEARWNIRRLAPHPSLVVWSGNNEMAWLGGNEKTVGTEIDDVTFFVRDLARYVQEEDPTRYYQPSSPFSPDGIEPNADHVGNQHPWIVGFKDTDFRKYRQMVCRFATEGGIMGATALPSIRDSLGATHPGATHPGSDPGRPWSFVWQQHDNSIAQSEHPSWTDQMMRDWLGKDPRALSAEEFCYWGGLLQSEALHEFADNFRRRMFDSACSGFWDFNDCWPAVRGWAIIDAQSRRAPAFYAVRRAYAAISVVVACEGDEVVVFGVNDHTEPCAAKLRHGIFELSGGYPLDQTIEATLAPNASTRLAAFPVSQWTRPDSGAAFAVLSRGDEVLARNRLFLPKFKDLQWPKANVTVRLENGLAIFASPVFAWAICLDLNGEEPLADNLFDLYPGQPHALAWPHARPPRIVNVGNLTG